MKYFISAITISLFIIIFNSSLLSQVNYVNINATGLDNGTSWNDAYTSLSEALENSNGGDIWIAAGNYTPTSAMMDSTTTFRLSNRYSIYGGFNGTESSIEERDILNNATILNADINGDDMPGDFDLNKDDNVQHVIFIDSLITDAVVLDGLTITGGYTGENGGQNESFFAGGGVFSYSTVEINNCLFNNNYAARGGAICISNATGGGNNSVINSCLFNQNRTSAQSAGIYASEVQGLRIENSDFTNNLTNRGAVQLSNTENSEIVSCNFIDNEGISTVGFGGALFSWQNRGLNITGCTFNNNNAGNGAVMYLDGRNVGDTEQTEVTISDCSFNNNMALDYGGSCIYAWQIAGLDVGDCQFTNNQGGNGGVMYLDGRELGAINSLRNTFSNCTFTDNRASDFGGGVLYNYQASCQFNTCTFTDNMGTNGSHLFNTGDNKNVEIINSTFTGGLADFGGAHTCYGLNSNYTLLNNTYEDNSASTSGGAMIIGFDSNVYMEECELIGNRAGYGGGVYMQNENLSLTIFNSLFQGNNASFNGGGVNVSGDHSVSIDRSTFDQNVAETGGGLFMGEFDAVNEATLTLSNSFFTNNVVTVQGGAINLLDVDATITNSVFGNNNTTGYGGAFSTNVTANNTLNYSLTNCTLAANGGLIGGIAQWQDVDNAELNLTLQNTLLFNNGPNYGIEEGEPNVFSNGGNFVSDNSVSDNLFVQSLTDVHSAGNPFFENIDELDFHLTAQSPAIDRGVAENAPTTDADGNSRLGAVDSGAFEYQESINTDDIILNNGQLSISPNPASEFLNLEINNTWSGELTGNIYDSTGRLVKRVVLNKSTSKQVQRFNISDLHPMVYRLVLTDGSKSIVEGFVKI